MSESDDDDSKKSRKRPRSRTKSRSPDRKLRKKSPELVLDRASAEAEAKALTRQELGLGSDEYILPYADLRELDYYGYAHYYIGQMEGSVKMEVIDELVRFDRILGTTETELSEVQAKALTAQELDKYSSYAGLRKAGFSGCAHNYMYEKKDAKTLTTAADLDTLMKFAKFDLVLDTKIEELIYSCCRFAPKMEFLVELFSLDTKTDEATLVKKLLNNSLGDGVNCLTACFELALSYEQKNNALPESNTGLMTDIEECVQFLIKKGDEHLSKEEMDQVLNQITPDGCTLFASASRFSEKLAEQLLDRGVEVKTMDAKFRTPRFLCENGINPATYSEVLGKGGEATVLGAELEECGTKVALKFVKVGAHKPIQYINEAMDDIDTRLNEMIKMNAAAGTRVLEMLGHYRQQICYEDDPKLASMLNMIDPNWAKRLQMQPNEVEQFEVFVTPLMDYSLKEIHKKKLKLKNIKSIIEQLLEGLEQLEAKNMTHNDLKPANILIKEMDKSTQMTNNKKKAYEVKIGDFGQAGKKGGTPGWTAPQFRGRDPGKADMYSVGLIILYLLVDDAELFYCLRDNFVRDDYANQSWMATFRSMPEIQFVMEMMDLGNQPTVAECEREWRSIQHKVSRITRMRLEGWIGVPACLLKLEKQDRNASTSKNVDILEAVAGKAAMSITKTVTNLTGPHDQKKTGFCWLLALATSLKRSMYIKAESLPDGEMKRRAMMFLKTRVILSTDGTPPTPPHHLDNKGKLHQLLRKEIQFGLIPKTLIASGQDENQGHCIQHAMYRLQYQGFLRKKRGLHQLETIQKFANILEQPIDKFEFDCCYEKVDTYSPKNWPRTGTKAPEHWPVIFIDVCFPGEKKPGGHAVALQEYEKPKNPQNEWGTLECKNTWEGEYTIKIEVKEDQHNQLIIPWTKDKDGKWKLRPGWKRKFNLGHPECWYVDFH